MRIERRAAGIVAAGLLSLAAGVALAAPPATWDGLELRKVKGVDAVYVRPGVEFKDYRSVYLDPVEVAFDKNWNPNRSGGSSNRMSSADIEKLRGEMASEFQRIFAEQLRAGGYQVVTQPGDDTLQVSAGLADVYVNAPDKPTAGRSYTFTVSAGRMTLVMELRDGPTAQLLARVVDQHVGRENGAMTLTNGVSNSAEFRRAVKGWADRLVKALDKVSGKAGPG
ncbi:MAG: DUF3313 family protein [Steroidobacteraceae bacterium]